MEDVAIYNAGCSCCQYGKADRHSKETKLVLMPTRGRPWKEIAIDFMGKLPISDSYNAILVMTDHFTKIQ